MVPKADALIAETVALYVIGAACAIAAGIGFATVLDMQNGINSFWNTFPDIKTLVLAHLDTILTGNLLNWSALAAVIPFSTLFDAIYQHFNPNIAPSQRIIEYGLPNQYLATDLGDIPFWDLEVNTPLTYDMTYIDLGDPWSFTQYTTTTVFSVLINSVPYEFKFMNGGAQYF